MQPVKYYENMEKKKGILVVLRDAQLLAKDPLEISFDFQYEDFLFTDNKIVSDRFEFPWGEDKKLRFRELQRKDDSSTRPEKQKIVESLVQKAVDHVLKEMKARLAKKA